MKRKEKRKEGVKENGDKWWKGTREAERAVGKRQERGKRREGGE